MASFDQHCKECEEKLGCEWMMVHRWLDEFFPKFFNEKHRDIRHHEVGIEQVRKMWGDEAAQAARLHIATDFFGWVPKNDREVQEWRVGIVHTPGLENKDGILVPVKK